MVNSSAGSRRLEFLPSPRRHPWGWLSVPVLCDLLLGNPQHLKSGHCPFNRKRPLVKEPVGVNAVSIRRHSGGIG